MTWSANVGVSPHEEEEPSLVDDRQLGVLDRHRRRAARRAIDQRHLTEGLVGPELEHLPVGLAELDLALYHPEHLTPRGARLEDHRLRRGVPCLGWRP